MPVRRALPQLFFRHAQPPLSQLHSWLGFRATGWEGETLETTHFTDQTSLRGSDEHLRVVERFSLEGPDALRYEFTIENPSAFTRPWSGAYTMTRTTELIYEFACHEGNYGRRTCCRRPVTRGDAASARGVSWLREDSSGTRPTTGIGTMQTMTLIRPDNSAWSQLARR